MDLFLRRYQRRIRGTFTYRSLDSWYALYLENGEEAFLEELEDEENFAYFCSKFYDILRENFNICSAGMRESYEQYKVKFAFDEDSYRHELMLAIDKRRKR
jgi:hypothetical protein